MVFQSGNTYGNRRGRPKKSATLSEFLRAELERAYNGQGISNKARIAEVLVKQACAGNLRAAAWIADRTEGTAPQRVEHSGPGGGPMEQRHEVEIRAVDYRNSIRALAPLEDVPHELRGVSDLYLPRLRPDQWAIATHPAKTKVIAMGRRWGKTVMAGAIALAAGNDGGRVAWVVPTYKNARPIWRWVESSVGGLVREGSVLVSRADRTVEFPATTGFLGVYSADSDVGLRGEAFHLVVLEEASRIAEATWSEVVMPTLADYAGDAILISTPMGRNWFWREWERGRAQMDGEQAAFTAPSTANPMPTIARAAALAQQRVPERVYRQEWLAEFLEDSGGVFRKVRQAATATPQLGPLAGHRYVVGVDWGKLVDWSVLCVIDATTREVVALDRFNRIDYVIQKGRLQALYERFRPDAIYVEQNSMGVPLVEDLQRLNLPVHPFLTTNASKLLVIDALALAFEREELRVLDDPDLVNELLAFQAERLPSGTLRYSAPEGVHDDCVMALALAWHGAAQPTQFVF